jgi:hypothetical protein
VRGIVKQLLVNTIGGVIQPGSDMVEIVPLDDTLLVEAKIRRRTSPSCIPARKRSSNSPRTTTPSTAG